MAQLVRLDLWSRWSGLPGWSGGPGGQGGPGGPGRQCGPGGQGCLVIKFVNVYG